MAGSSGARADTFDAGQFGVLRFTFQKFGGPVGIITDPSDDMIEDYLNSMREVAKKYGGDDDLDTEGMTDEELVDHLETDGRLRIAEAQKEIGKALAALCGGQPNYEDIMKVPFRIRQRFQRWLTERLLNPESEASDGADSRVRRIGG